VNFPRKKTIGLSKKERRERQTKRMREEGTKGGKRENRVQTKVAC
jgi:hypothetical protein